MNNEVQRLVGGKTTPKNILSPEISYTIGKFMVLLDADTGELKIFVHTNSDKIMITPRCANSISVRAIGISAFEEQDNNNKQIRH